MLTRTIAGASAHTTRAAGLELLADTAALARHLHDDGVLEPAGTWTGHFGRFHPDRTVWAVVVLRDGDRLRHVQVADMAPEGRPDRPASRLPGGGWATVDAFPHDQALPGLAGVLAALDDHQVIRYRPGHRCTVRGVVDGRPRFTKVTADAAPIHVDSVELWRAHLRGELGFDVATPIAHDSDRHAVHLGVVAGSPLAPLVFGPDGEHWARRIGEALGSLALADVSPLAVADHHEQLERSVRAADRAAARVPDLGERLDGVLTQLTRLHGELDPRPLVPVHGAPHVHQWLIDGDRLGLVDFDRFALGDPELDVATLLGELDTESALTVPVDAIEHAVVDGYEAVAGPLDRHRLWLYRVHKRLAKVSRTTLALRVDGDRRAERHLRSVEALLSGGGAGADEPGGTVSDDTVSDGTVSGDESVGDVPADDERR